MAKIQSLTGNKSIILKPYAYENAGESWLLCELQFQKSNQNVLKVYEAFLEDRDIDTFIRNALQLINGSLESVLLEPLEPYFSLTISAISNINYEVYAQYDLGDNTSKEIEINVNKDQLLEFIKNLDSDMNNIRNIV